MRAQPGAGDRAVLHTVGPLHESFLPRHYWSRCYGFVPNFYAGQCSGQYRRSAASRTCRRLVPYSLLPIWARDIAPAVPSYWAMQGYKHAIFGEGTAVVEPILILLGFSILFALIALARFRFDEAKVGLL